METKSIFSSVTIWGALVALLCTGIHNLTGVNLASYVGPLGAAITALINALPAIAAPVGQIAGIVVAIVGRFRATQPLHIIAPVPPSRGNSSSSVGAVSMIGLTAVGLVTTLALVGCAGGEIPAQFDSPPAAAPLSATDTKIVRQLATIDAPASLATIETSASTLTSIGMYVGIKQPATMAKDGELLHGTGLVMQSPAAGTLPTSASVGNIVAGLSLSAADQQSAANFSTLGQSLNGVVGLINTQINSLASQTSNPSVAAYAARVGEDVMAAVGRGICDATSQYVAAPASSTSASSVVTFFPAWKKDDDGIAIATASF